MIREIKDFIPKCKPSCSLSMIRFLIRPLLMNSFSRPLTRDYRALTRTKSLKIGKSTVNVAPGSFNRINHDVNHFQIDHDKSELSDTFVFVFLWSFCVSRSGNDAKVTDIIYKTTARRIFG